MSPRSPRAGVGNVSLAEWTKLRSVGSTGWLVAAAAFLGIAITTISALQSREVDRDLVRTAQAATIGLFVVPIVLSVLGVLAATSEYASGMIRTTLAAVGSRIRLALAKAIVLGAVSLVVGAGLGVAAYAVVFLTSTASVAPLTEPDVLRAVVIGPALSSLLLTLLGLGIGLLVRHTAGGVTLVLMLVFLPPILAVFLPAELGSRVQTYSPQGLLVVLHSPVWDDAAMSWPRALLSLAVWAAIALVGGALAMNARDA